MPNAKPLLIFAMIVLGAIGLAACSAENNPDQNVIITDTIPAGADIEALPPDEGSVADQDSNGLSPEEQGDGDDMVNIVDDTSSSDTRDQ